MGLVDFHSHLLVGVDDGVQDEQKQRELFAAYQAAGIDRIVCTPHVYNPYVTSKVSLFRQRFEEATAVAGEYGIQTYFGCELFVGQQEQLKGLPIMGKYVLCEFDRFLPTANLMPRLKRLNAQGLTIVIAHVERYMWLTPDCELTAQLQELDLLFQVNVEGVENGSATPWLEQRIPSIMATDNHGDATLPGRLCRQIGAYPYLYKRMARL